MLNVKELLVFKILRTTAGWAIHSFINLALRIRNVTREHFCEKRLGIITTGYSLVKEDVTMFKDSIEYAPTPYEIIKKILEKLQFGPDDVFIDLGCVKGRLIFSVAEKRLKKVIGVEARKDLFDIASDNLKNAKRKNTPVEIFNEDAASFDMREGSVFFLCDPFGKNTLAKVIQNIKKSLAADPRKIRIVCCECPDLSTLEGSEWLACESSLEGGMIKTWSSRGNNG